VDLLSKIDIKNVGPFDGEDISIDFKLLTIIIGANNTGKSSTLYSFDIFRSTEFLYLYSKFIITLLWNNIC
jgi:predicted ATPase